MELLVVEVEADSTRRTAFVVRCHAGTLRVDDTLTAAVDPSGTSHDIDARCLSIRLHSAIPADELATNFGGLVTLEAPNLSAIGADWLLRTER